MTTLDQANEFLNSGGVPPAKFETAGTTVTGKVLHAEKQQQREIATGKPKYWDDGTQREQLVVQLETSQRNPEIPDDDGRRALYVRGNMLKALRAALKRAGGRLEAGGTLTVTYTGDGERTAAGFNPPKLYTVHYAPPAQSAVADMLGDTAAPGAPAPAAAPVPAGMTAQQWDALPQAARDALTQLQDTPPY
jgi:hypothetical protein